MSLQQGVMVRRLSRRLIFRLVLFSSFAVRGGAQGATSPGATVQALYNALLRIMRAGRATSFQQRYAQLAPVVDTTFDLAAILEASVGPSWTQMTADEHSALLGALRRYTVDSYVDNFDTFSGQRFEIAPDTRALGNGEQVVTTQIIPTTGEAHRLDYVMRPNGGTWRVVDVLADGTISRVATQRSDFRRLLMQGGPTALVASLQRKSQDLEAG
jgi:phospholipid transport system substrate-binding protein